MSIENHICKTLDSLWMKRTKKTDTLKGNNKPPVVAKVPNAYRFLYGGEGGNNSMRFLLILFCGEDNVTIGKFSLVSSQSLVNVINHSFHQVHVDPQAYTIILRELLSTTYGSFLHSFIPIFHTTSFHNYWCNKFERISLLQCRKMELFVKIIHVRRMFLLCQCRG